MLRTALSLAIGLGLIGIPSVIQAADVLISNGLGPPEPTNVLSDASHAADDVYLRNTSCGTPANPLASCASPPGSPTNLLVTAAGDAQRITVRDSSQLNVEGGHVGTLTSQDSSYVLVDGGTIDAAVLEGATMTVLDGTVGSIDSGDAYGGSLHIGDGVIGPVMGVSTTVDGGTVASISTAPWYGGGRITINAGRVTGLVDAHRGFDMLGGQIDGDLRCIYDGDCVVAGGQIGGSAWVGDASSPLVVTGGVIHGDLGTLGGFATDSIAMLGGIVEGSALMREGSLLLDGGIIETDFVALRGLSSLEMHSGQIGGDVVANNLSSSGPVHLTIDGGTIGGDILLEGAASAKYMDISGGTVDGMFDLRGLVYLTLVGSSFEVDGQAVPYGPLEALSGQLTGTLLSGSPLDNFFVRDGTGPDPGGYQLFLQPVPEPGGATLFAVGLAILSGCGSTRRYDA